MDYILFRELSNPYSESEIGLLLLFINYFGLVLIRFEIIYNIIY